MGSIGIHGLAYERVGGGEPLLLIHGTGSSRLAWAPVVSLLAESYELVLVDLPGHGNSDCAPTAVAPTPVGWAPLVADLVESLGFERVHTAGFSIGGWISLELAKLGRACCVAALGPAGLWNPRSPRASELSLWLSHRMARAFARLMPSVLATAAGRTLLLSQQFGRPWRLSANEALGAARTIASTRGFDAHLNATNRTRFRDGQQIGVPVTIAFGARERLLSKQARRREELPSHTRWIDLPGCGHVPMRDDPQLVAATIRKTAAHPAH